MFWICPDGPLCPTSPSGNGPSCLHRGLKPPCHQHNDDSTEDGIWIPKSLEFEASIDCSRGDSLSKGVLMICFGLGWVPMEVPWEAGNNGRVSIWTLEELTLVCTATCQQELPF